MRAPPAPPTIDRIAHDHAAPEERALPIRLFLADVDGTLVTQDKVLTPSAVAAVRSLRQAGVLFAVTSGRPPRGMEMLVDPLDLDTPIAAFNGGLVVDRAMQVLEQHVIPEHLVVPVADHMRSFDLAVWLYRGADWYVPDPKGPHVDREAWTVKFEPKVMDGFDGLTDGVAKLVGVSDDHDAIEAAVHAAAEKFGDHVTAAASQPYYLDVTSPDANKGSVARSLANALRARARGDRHHRRPAQRHLDVRPLGPQHRHGQRRPRGEAGGPPHPQTNEDEGFAFAVEHFVLPAASSDDLHHTGRTSVPSRFDETEPITPADRSLRPWP